MRIMIRAITFLALVGLSLAGPPISRTREEIESFAQFLDRTSNGVPLPQLAAAMQPGSQLNAEELSGKFDGDILLDEVDKAALLQQYAGTAGARNAVFLPTFLWPNNEVIYEIDEAAFSPEQVAAIEAGVADLENVSCVKFTKRVNEPDFVRVTGLAGGCYAHVGFRLGRGIHVMNLAPNAIGVGCFRHGTVVHEFLHNLAFYHMQSTYNRDDYVRIVEENLIPGTEHNFALTSPETVSNLGVDYDFSSCLHYTEYAFSNNGERTIIPHEPYAGVIGQRIGLSEKDIIRLNRLYSCPGW